MSVMKKIRKGGKETIKGLKKGTRKTGKVVKKLLMQR